VAQVVEVLPDDAVLREVVWIEAPYLTECFGEHAPIEAATWPRRYARSRPAVSMSSCTLLVIRSGWPTCSSTGGQFASLLSVGPDQFADRNIIATAVFASPQRSLLETLAGEVAAGRLRIPVMRSYTLDEVPKAFADFAAGTLGKLAVTIV
jgi:NADPH:quinone reductase-like Zn-dependent oxidoreductase